MNAAETELLEETDPVEAWRAEQLELAGFGAAAAAELAMRQDIDLHAAIEMVSRGCSQELALKILL
jgi:hypothetical protein